MIITKDQAKYFLRAYSEFSLPVYFGDSIWFRYDGEGEYKKPYTIYSEDEGIIGATEDEAASYIYRNRKVINAFLNDNGETRVRATRRQ